MTPVILIVNAYRAGMNIRMGIVRVFVVFGKFQAKNSLEITKNDKTISINEKLTISITMYIHPTIYVASKQETCLLSSEGFSGCRSSIRSCLE